MDRVPDFGSGGSGFESLQPCFYLINIPEQVRHYQSLLVYTLVLSVVSIFTIPEKTKNSNQTTRQISRRPNVPTGATEDRYEITSHNYNVLITILLKSMSHKDTIKLAAKNRKAFHNYEVLERFETGIALKGTEVKSVRAGKLNISDSYALCKNGEIILHHMHISPFEAGNRFNHDPYRKRKLLLRKREIAKLCSETERKQLTLVPLSVYFKKQWVKLELGLCRGRKKYDKRQNIAEKESKKRIANIMRTSSRR